MSVENNLKKQKVCIITGSSAGIGKTIASIMAKAHYFVILANRDLNKAGLVLNDLKNISDSVLSLELDLSSFDSIKKFVNEFKNLNVTLDCLINNAGIYCPPYSLTKDGFESQFGVNHLGVFLLTNLLLDSIDKETGRIVNLSSHSYKKANLNLNKLNESKENYKPMVSYGNSKLCTLLFTYELNRILKARNSNIVVLALHPGVIPDTTLFRHLPGYAHFALSIAKPFLTDVNTASIAVSRLAIGSDPDLHDIKGGQYFNILKLETTSQFSTNINNMRKLWVESCKFCQINDIGVN
ncbi:hypothetical protein DICPUDRAFT_56653 [Dictyostelium purpureum]|uniref:Uncharacterized protein n=1 Tax=Dictyostelium purpureum TaxID=5786 RepID=F0ZSG3_DICPU|nr:uncharacterized protein DICPUDRAFT_56653 [Dictyostelium purpureum]EGC33113.1 hypothetical protein DICPUDRAFT_56653 [Dictyostelium purpureum]|eukprot:XP_003290350.1 hypothetical protein DICPUDRAFT_56653 [Dictyostelium purpureum]